MKASLRASAGAVVAAALVLLTSSAAFAFTVQLGFSATTYASGYVSGAPAGVAFIGTTMYSADPGDGGLYASATAGAPVRVGTIGGAPTGLAAFGGSLFAIQSAATFNDVVQVNPANGAPGTTLASNTQLAGLRLNGIAADPVNGDLYLAAEQGYIWVIRAPYTAGPVFLLQLTGAPATFGITVAPDHSLYVATERLGSSGIRQITPSLAQGLVGPEYTGARGVGVIPGYIFASNADGSIFKIVNGAGSSTYVVALSAGDVGGPAAIGSDGCFYASQGAAVVRLANADTTCNLASAAPPADPPAITLIRTSTTQPLIGNGDQVFTAQITNVTPLSGIPVVFTVTRDASVPATYLRQTDTTGAATFGYTASTTGTDTITAVATVNTSTTLTSAPISLTWPRALDTVPPIISYTVTGDHNPNPVDAPPVFSCPNLLLGTPGNQEYCGWYTGPPTVHWTVTQGVGGTTAPIYSCPDYTLNVSSPATGTPTTCSATNGDGKPAALMVVLQAVLSAPTISYSASTAAGPYTGAVPTNQDVTVSFSCATDPILGPAGISFCGPTQTVTAEGTHTVSGYVLDVAGTRQDASFGPFIIDKTPPVVTADMWTIDSVTLARTQYTPGTPTTQNVLVHFTCTDAVGMAPTGCPGDTTVTAGPSVTVSATDLAGNIGTYTFGGIDIDRTGPAVTATITPAPDANGNNAFTATVTLTATDPSGVASVTYTYGVNGQPPVGPVIVSGGTAQVALSVVGTTMVSFFATDTLGNVSATGTVTVHIVSRQASTLRIVSPPAQIAGASAIQIALTGPGGVPVAGRSVTITGAGAPQTAITGADGTARLGVPVAPGSYTIGATFSGDSQWYPSAASTQTLVVAGATQFVIWGGNAAGVQAGQRVVFWGEHWWDGVQLPQQLKVQEFKGWAATVGATTWSTKPGDSKPPRAVPTYVSVVITTSVHRVRGSGGDADEDGGRSSGDRITGNVVGHAILRVDPGYKDEPGKAVTGVVMAILP